MDAAMYEGMSTLKPADDIIERGISLHKARAAVSGLYTIGPPICYLLFPAMQQRPSATSERIRAFDAQPTSARHRSALSHPHAGGPPSAAGGCCQSAGGPVGLCGARRQLHDARQCAALNARACMWCDTV